MGTDLLERPGSRRREDTPCSCRGCDQEAGWLGTPICHHPQVFCTVHMLRFSQQAVRAHCIVCRSVTPSAAIIWEEWRR